MIHGDARDSTGEQDFANQLAELKSVGCDPIFRDKITGVHAERPQLWRLLRKVSQGDVVIVSAVDRLSRDTTDLLVLDLDRRGVGFRTLTDSFDTKTALGRG